MTIILTCSSSNDLMFSSAFEGVSLLDGPAAKLLSSSGSEGLLGLDEIDLARC